MDRSDGQTKMMIERAKARGCLVHTHVRDLKMFVRRSFAGKVLLSAVAVLHTTLNHFVNPSL